MSTLRTRGDTLSSSTRSPATAPIRAAWTAAAIFCGVAAFHAAVALGAPWGEYTQGGGTSGVLTTTGRVTAAASCVLTIVMAGAVLARVGRGPLGGLPVKLRTVLSWFTLAYGVIGVVLNLITRSASERTVFAPVTLVLLALVAFVLAGTHRSQRGAAARS